MKRPSTVLLTGIPLGFAWTPSPPLRVSVRLCSSPSDLDSLHLTAPLAALTETMASIPNERSRQRELLQLAATLAPLDDSLRTPANKVPGCLSTVHIGCTARQTEGNGDPVVDYVGDSDGLLTKGLLALLIQGLSGCTPRQIEQVDASFIRVAKLSQSLTPGRNNGFLNMLQVMKKKAWEAVEKETRNVDSHSDTAAAIIYADRPMYNTILSKLTSSPILRPTSVHLVDNSSQHAGHVAAQQWNTKNNNGNVGETHFALVIVADTFEGLSLVQRHKLIYALLGQEVMQKIHALEIQAKTPNEVV